MGKLSFRRIPVGVFFVFLFLGVACNAPRELTTVKVRPLSTGRLLKKIEQNKFEYEYFSVRRINCRFSSSKNKTSFRINLKAQKDKQILVSISKLSIPVGRVLFTPDSVVYVNYIAHNYFKDDYSYLSNLLNMSVNFSTVQSIISNNVFSYRKDPRNDYRAFDSFVEDGKYVLQSAKTRKIFKFEQKGKIQKIDRRLKRLGDEALIVQKMFFDPLRFSLTRLDINDKTYNRSVRVNFDNFTAINGERYPEKITMRFVSAEEQIQMNISMSGFSSEKIKTLSLKIPKKYKQIEK